MTVDGRTCQIPASGDAENGRIGAENYRVDAKLDIGNLVSIPISQSLCIFKIIMELI